MSVQEITTDQLRRMEGKEGLILQGCGGSLLDWQNGINNLLHMAILSGQRGHNPGPVRAIIGGQPKT